MTRRKAHSRWRRLNARSKRTIRRFRPAWCMPMPVFAWGIPYANAGAKSDGGHSGTRRACGAHEGAARGQGPQDGPDADQDDHCTRPEGEAPRRCRLVLDRTFSVTATARCSTIRNPSKTKEESKKSVLDYTFSRSSIGSVRKPCPRRAYQLLPAARRQQGKAGTTSFCFGWLGLPHAAEDQLPMPRQHPGAPIVLDVALFMDLASGPTCHGIQEWLSFYFKSPVHAPVFIPNTIYPSSC